MGAYFDTIGRIDPLDLFGVPAFVPRIGQLRVRSTLRFFDRLLTRSFDAAPAHGRKIRTRPQTIF